MDPLPPWTESISNHIVDLKEMMMVAIREIQRELELPEFSRVFEAAGVALGDAQRAFRSSYLFLVLVGRPVFLLLKIVLRPLLFYLWLAVRGVFGWLNKCLVPWVLQNGGNQMRSLAVAVHEFHKQRTPKELLVEAAIVGSIILIYRLYRVVQHHQWVARTRQFTFRKLRALEQVSLHASVIGLRVCVYVQELKSEEGASGQPWWGAFVFSKFEVKHHACDELSVRERTTARRAAGSARSPKNDAASKTSFDDAEDAACLNLYGLPFLLHLVI